MPKQTVRVPKIVPRGLRRPDAAAYVGVSDCKFDEWVSRSIMPQPKRIDGIVVWDRFELDSAFEALPDGQQVASDARWDNVSN